MGRIEVSEVCDGEPDTQSESVQVIDTNNVSKHMNAPDMYEQ